LETTPAAIDIGIGVNLYRTPLKTRSGSVTEGKEVNLP
jgi:hypothetical protein